MTATARLSDPVLRLPFPLPQQEPILKADARFKVLQCGRRWGKTRAAMLAALDGHGPRVTRHKPTFPGVLQGWDVIWLAPTRDQAGIIWREELKPRLTSAGVFHLNETDRTATGPNGGMLHLVSAEAMTARVKGSGKRLKGVILDEAAWLDLEYAWGQVVRPALMDNEGWAIFMSTTNAGPDGNPDRRMPSYFNLICEEIRDGHPRRKGWERFTGTVFDNPKIDPDEANEFIAEFEPGCLALEQEVYAKLLKPGAGLALEQMDAQVHMVDAFRPPAHWTEWGAFDWGYNHPFFFGWFASDEDGNAYLVDSVTGRGKTPAEIAEIVTMTMPWRRFYMIHAGHDCWAMKGRAIGEDTPSIAETFGEHGLYLLPANRDLIQGLDLMRRMVRWYGDEGKQKPTGLPRFRIMRTPVNEMVFRQLSALQIDPKHPEKPLKQDAVNGKGGDDGADMVRYGLAARFLKAVDPREDEPFYAGSQEALDVEYEKGHRVGNRGPRLVPKADPTADMPFDAVVGQMW